MQLLYATINDGAATDNIGMTSAILEPLPEKEIILSDPTIDVREIYLKEIFAPNRFSALTLRKALGVS